MDYTVKLEYKINIISPKRFNLYSLYKTYLQGDFITFYS